MKSESCRLFALPLWSFDYILRWFFSSTPHQRYHYRATKDKTNRNHLELWITHGRRANSQQNQLVPLWNHSEFTVFYCWACFLFRCFFLVLDDFFFAPSYNPKNRSLHYSALFIRTNAENFLSDIRFIIIFSLFLAVNLFECKRIGKLRWSNFGVSV